MKKLRPLFIFLFGLTIFSCSSDDNSDYVDYDTYPVVYDLTNVNFELVDGVYQVYREFDTPLYDSDVVLVYIQNGSNGGSPIWQQIPITFYLTDGNEVDYNFDFSKYDVLISAGGTFNLDGSSYVLGKTLRIVLVPGSFGKDLNTNVDYSDYNSVIQYYNIDDSHPSQL